jgi:hypothetical protein
MFEHLDGTFEPVPEIGPMLAYYEFLPRNSPPNHIKAFPPGFKMLSGDSRRRNFTLPMPVPEKSLWAASDKTQSALAEKALGFNCLHYGSPNEGAVKRHALPDKGFIDANCYSGLRLELAFPSCWNGKDHDSPDHKSHVAYSSLVIDGDCPAGFETRVPLLFFETIYDTPRFKRIPGRFVLGNGDPTGEFFLQNILRDDALSLL